MNDEAYPGLTVAVRSDAAAEISWRLEQLGAQAIEERDDTTLSSASAEQTLLLAGFETRQQRDIAARELVDLRCQTDPRVGEIVALDVSDDGWRHGWREFFRPVVLETLEVVAPWMERPGSARRRITIDPGLAFGTGGHATTRQLLLLLERAAQRAELPARVLDVGTGSGVLAITAALLGAERVRAIDNDPDAVTAASANVRANAVGDRVHVSLGDPDGLSGEWPLVLANLELTLFQRYGAALARALTVGGTALVSGLLVEQAAAGRRCWPGCEQIERIDADGWSALAFRRMR